MDFVEGFLDLNFISSSVHDESKGVSFGHHFVGFFGVEGMSQN